MKQRVGLARALVADTDVKLIDQAFSVPDPPNRTGMQDQLLQSENNPSKTIIFVKRDLNEILGIGHEIAIVKDGRLAQVGTPYQILNSPADEYVARLVQRRAGAEAAHHA